MTALAVDNHPVDLERLCEAIQANHPEMEIIRFLDPLLAFKYSLTHTVDALYTAVLMKRLNGFQLEKMIREDHPRLAVNFVADDDSYREKAIRHMAFSYTIKPVTAEKLVQAEAEEW